MATSSFSFHSSIIFFGGKRKRRKNNQFVVHLLPRYFYHLATDLFFLYLFPRHSFAFNALKCKNKAQLNLGIQQNTLSHVTLPFSFYLYTFHLHFLKKRFQLKSLLTKFRNKHLLEMKFMPYDITFMPHHIDFS